MHNKPNKTFYASFEAQPFSLVTKPAGPGCNLNCTYCFYLEKQQLFQKSKNFRMSDELLEEFIRQYIQSQEVPIVSFVWQGGEPCLAGLEFYKKAVAFQKKYGKDKTIENAFQTNGILLNKDWCRFFYDNRFLIGISIDGPEKLHNKFRFDFGNKPVFYKVIRAIEMLEKNRVEFNTLTTVNSYNVDFPDEIYHFLKSIGSRFMQFLPVVERESTEIQHNGLKTVTRDYQKDAIVTNWSVNPIKYGIFMSRIFDLWVRQDVGKIFVQLFDATLANWHGVQPGICLFTPSCGNAGAIEHNGDVFSCDHFVYPEYYLGNIMENTLVDLMNSSEQQMFGQNKFSTLPKYCMQCRFLNKCYGECPKKRFLYTPDGEYGLNYLCEGYKYFFAHVSEAMDFMDNELRNQRPPTNVMNFIKQKNRK
jgi:uncharacterized protein